MYAVKSNWIERLFMDCFNFFEIFEGFLEFLLFVEFFRGFSKLLRFLTFLRFLKNFDFLRSFEILKLFWDFLIFLRFFTFLRFLDFFENFWPFWNFLIFLRFLRYFGISGRGLSVICLKLASFYEAIWSRVRSYIPGLLKYTIQQAQARCWFMIADWRTARARGSASPDKLLIENICFSIWPPNC